MFKFKNKLDNTKKYNVSKNPINEINTHLSKSFYNLEQYYHFIHLMKQEIAKKNSFNPHQVNNLNFIHFRSEKNTLNPNK